MKTAVVLRHVPFEDLGTLAETLNSQGYTWHYLEAPVCPLATLDPLEADLLIVLGGPIGVYDEAQYPFLSEEIRFIGARLAQQRPVLGICLGAQLMARALDADVAPMGVKEIGYSPLQLRPVAAAALLTPLANVPVLHWHGDRFEIPATATHLASSAVCDNQAFLLGHYGLALQFHLEVSAEGLESWLVGHACELGVAGIDPRHLRQQAASHSRALTRAAQQVIGDWLDQVAD